MRIQGFSLAASFETRKPVADLADPKRPSHAKGLWPVVDPAPYDHTLSVYTH